MALWLAKYPYSARTLHIGERNIPYTILLFFHCIYTGFLSAELQHCLGMIHLDLEEFEEAQKHLQSSFETCKAVYGVKAKKAMEVCLRVATAARLAGNLQDAKELLETAEKSMLGKTINIKVYTYLAQ